MVTYNTGIETTSYSPSVVDVGVTEQSYSLTVTDVGLVAATATYGPNSNVAPDIVEEVVNDGDQETIDKITEKLIGQQGDDLPFLESDYLTADGDNPVLVFNADDF